MRELVGLFSHPKRHLKKLVKEGEYKEALEYGESIEEKFSHDADFFFIMGSIYYILEDAQNALYYFDKSLAINEDDTEALLLKANVHLYLKENKVVQDCCNKILQVDPQNNDAKEILNNLEQN